MKPRTYSALVRGDDGSLEVRRFDNQEDATAAEASREVAPERKGGRDYTTGEIAKIIGISQRTIMRRCDRGEIPFKDQGTLGCARRMISTHTLRLIKTHGLRGLARMIQAGLL
jgi:hypothetical protein